MEKRNEHFIEREDGSSQKRITDSHFMIREGNIENSYHMECESSEYDSTILLRIFEYTSQIAMDSAERTQDKLYVQFPKTGLLLLRAGNRDPEDGVIIISTPEGELSYKIPILKMADIGIDEIFEQQLYFLLPFFIFNYEKCFGELENDHIQMEELADDYRHILERLREEESRQNGRLSTFSFGVIINLIERVSFNLTKKHVMIQKKVGDIVGGQILDLEWIRFWEEAKAEERVNTDAERQRAEIAEQRANDAEQRANSAEQRAARAEAEVMELRAQLAKAAKA